MAVGLETGVPWVMCKQDDAPDPVVRNSSPLRSPDEQFNVFIHACIHLQFGSENDNNVLFYRNRF